MVRGLQLLIIVRFECKEGDGDIKDIRLGHQEGDSDDDGDDDDDDDGDGDDDDDTPGVGKIALHLLFGWSLDKDKKSLDQSKQFS